MACIAGCIHVWTGLKPVHYAQSCQTQHSAIGCVQAMSMELGRAELTAWCLKASERSPRSATLTETVARLG